MVPIQLLIFTAAFCGIASATNMSYEVSFPSTGLQGGDVDYTLLLPDSSVPLAQEEVAGSMVTDIEDLDSGQSGSISSASVPKWTQPEPVTVIEPSVPAVSPEPGTLVLMGSVLVTLGVVTRKLTGRNVQTRHFD